MTPGPRPGTLGLRLAGSVRVRRRWSVAERFGRHMDVCNHLFTQEPTGLGAGVARLCARSVLRMVERFAPVPARFLEIGPGGGLFAEECVRRGHEYAGVEGNAAQAAKLRDAGLDVVHAMVPPLPAELYGFHCVFAGDVLEHMQDWRTAGELLVQVRERLAPGGVVALLCPDAVAWGGRFRDGDYSHAFATTLRNTQKLLVDCGFIPVSHAYYSGPFRGVARWPFRLLNSLSPVRLLDALAGPACPPRRLTNLYFTFLQDFLVVARAGSPSGSRERGPQ